MAGAGKTLDQQIERAKGLLATVQHAAMATVNADGSPHNTPLVFLHSPDLVTIYWGSHRDSLHSQNVLRTGQVFVVLFEADQRGGLYIRADQGRIAEGTELDEALAIHNQFRQRLGKPALNLDYYREDSPQRMWLAETKQFWVNGSQRDDAGLIIKDIRTEISVQDLL